MVWSELGVVRDWCGPRLVWLPALAGRLRAACDFRSELEQTLTMNSTTMGLAEALARDVSERTRTRGNRYFLGGAVRAIEGSGSEAVATVRGSEWYRVRLSRDGDAFLASCQCPYFADRQDFCKHIWAVVLAADAEGFLLDDPLTDDA